MALLIFALLQRIFLQSAFIFFSSRRRHTICLSDWSSDVCSSDLTGGNYAQADATHDHYARLTERNLPTVLINAAIDQLSFPTVSCDDAVAAEQALTQIGRASCRERVSMSTVVVAFNGTGIVDARV